jgi:hypothetical protein
MLRLPGSFAYALPGSGIRSQDGGFSERFQPLAGFDHL